MIRMKTFLVYKTMNFSWQRIRNLFKQLTWSISSEILHFIGLSKQRNPLRRLVHSLSYWLKSMDCGYNMTQMQLYGRQWPLNWMLSCNFCVLLNSCYRNTLFPFATVENHLSYFTRLYFVNVIIKKKNKNAM